MSQLDPQLSGLFRWARRCPDQRPPPEAPFGFSARVVARWQAEDRTPAPFLGARALALSAWLSAGMIVGGLALFAHQSRPPENAYDFTPAYQLVAQNITR